MVMTLDDIKDIIGKSKSTKLDCPVCMPSYKFRKNAWLVRNLETLDAKVYLFLYDDDYHESGYINFKFPKNVDIFLITKLDFETQELKWRGIQPKRRFIQNTMKTLGYKKFFMIDDDFKCGIYPSERRQNACESFKMSEISINDLLKAMNLYKSLYCNDVNIMGIDLSPYTCFSKLKGFKKEKHVGGIYLFDNAKTMFSGEMVHEDTDLLLRALDVDKIGILDFLSAKWNCNNDSVVENNQDILHFNDFLKYPNYIKLKYDEKKDIITSHINDYAIKHRSKNYDSKLYEIVKTKDYEKIKNYLCNVSNNKNNIDDW